MDKEEILKMLQKDVEECDKDSKRGRIFYHRNNGCFCISLDYNGNYFYRISMKEAAERISKGTEYGGIR